MRIKWLLSLILVCTLSGPLSTWAAWDVCVIVDLSAWTTAQRVYLAHVVAEAVSNLPTRHTFVGNALRLCAETALPTLESATLQSAAQAIADAHSTAHADRDAQRTAALNEVRTNNLCTATLAEVINRLTTIHDNIQIAIDAINATGTVAKVQTALTLENDRQTAINIQLATCILGRAILRGEE